MNLDYLDYLISDTLNSMRVDFPIFLLFWGQSNTTGHSFSSGDRSTKNKMVYLLETNPVDPGQTVGWKCAGPDSNDWPYIKTGNSYPYHICDLVQRRTGRPVVGVIVAAGGQPICKFLPTNSVSGLDCGSMWNVLVANMALARTYALPFRQDLKSMADLGCNQVDGVFGWQGEADADYRGTTGAEWKARLLMFDGLLRNGIPGSVPPILKKNAPFLISELIHGGKSGPNTTDDRNVEIAQLDREQVFIASWSADGLSAPDGLHAEGASLVESARRAVDRLGIFPKLVPIERSDDVTEIGGRIVHMKGEILVNAGSTHTISLQKTMCDDRYIPSLTLLMSGASVTTGVKVENRTSTSFDIYNPTAVNMILGWQILGISG